jgi:(1->4)-alpha-D-glucan 1-alpha-D-glucosylmutase
VVLKGVLPGVPDHYQGTEFWDFRLVDPDNRQPVDFDTRRHRLQSLEEAYAEDPAALVRRLSEGWEDRLKMFVLWRTLQIREHLPEVFAVGDYIPLPTEGPLEEHLVAIARRWKRRWAVATTVRLPWGLKRDVPSRAWGDKPSDFCGDLWGETRVMLPEEAPDEWTDGVGGRTIGADRRAIPAARLFDELPVSLLYCE